MRAMLLSTMVLGALTTAALADEPITLTPDQMDKVTAGAAQDPFFTRGSTGVVSPGTPAGTGPAQIFHLPFDPNASPTVILTSGAVGSVFPGDPAEFR